MQYAVLLYFDEKSKNDIKNRISKIDVENYDIGLPPHITLFSWFSESADNYIEQIKVFASSRTKIKMTLSSFGVFNTMGKYLFLSPVRSDDFSLLHNDLIDSIKLSANDTYEELYVNNDKWVPHCTIGYRLTNQSLPVFLSQAIECFELPMAVLGSKLAICTIEPLNVIETFELLGK